MFSNRDEVAFSQALGKYVELELAPSLLSKRYSHLEYLGPTFPWADFYGYRNGRFWLISVKGRFIWDQYETRKAGGQLKRNPNYKLDGNLSLALRFRAGELAWLTVPVDFTGNYSAYHGTIEHLRTLGLGGSGVPMSSNAIRRNDYDLLGTGRHAFPFEMHPNVWAFNLWKTQKS